MTPSLPAAPRVAFVALLVSLAAAARAGTLPGAATADGASVDLLIARARKLSLSREVEWLRLGHYRKVALKGYQSEARGPDFFLAEGGAQDPAAELDATLYGIFGLSRLTPDQQARKVMAPVCRFPARVLWLQQKLQFDPALLAREPCDKLMDVLERTQPESVSLVFSAYYLNNPSSMFGHTFLRIHKRGEAASAGQRELLDYSVDFSADVDTNNPVAYAFKGFSGMFPGTFKLMPYYIKVREYNDYESRDLWEYQLALKPEQLLMLTLHLFELGSAYFDYYYSDENCSYHILAALEAAGPELALLDSLKFPVVPADTVKALYLNRGLVSGYHYRPSATTQFHARVRDLPHSQLDSIEALARDAEAPLPASLAAEDQIHLFDAAADLIDIRFAKEIPFHPDGEGGRLKQRVLERRAALLLPSEPLRIDPPAREVPHQAHGASRLTLGGGGSDAEGGYLTLSLRLALHALDDAPGGYPDLAGIEFLPLELRTLPRSGDLRVERFDLANALSLHDMTWFDQRLSWKLRIGAGRVHDAGCRGCLAASATVGTGAALAFGPAVVFALGEASAEASSALQGISGARGVRGGIGPSGGLRLHLFDSLTLLATAYLHWLPGAAGSYSWGTETSLRISLPGDTSLGLEARQYPDANEAGLSGYWFF